MKCVTCNAGTMRPGPVELRREVDGHVFTTTVDGKQCSSCGEVYFEGTDLARFELAVARILAESGAESGDAFRWMRKALDLRAIDVAELLEVTPETVSRWETGRVAVDRAALMILGLMVVDQAHGSTATIDALRARAAAKPLAKTVTVKLAS
jgi:putative zinc finger/helix-turn-helix YgiT family protein